MARGRRTSIGTACLDRGLRTIREGILPERRQSRSGPGRRRTIRGKSGRGRRVRTRFERTKADGGGLAPERELPGGSAEAYTYGQLGLQRDNASLLVRRKFTNLGLRSSAGPSEP